MADVRESDAENLFRKQALMALAERPYGRPVCRVPTPWSWITVLLVCLAVALALFAARAEYSRKERVRGWLVPQAGAARITHGAGAVVDELLRTPGELVKAGDAIMVLSRNTYLDDGRNSVDSIVQELQIQVAAIEERIRLLREQTRIELESDKEQLASVAAGQRAIRRQRNQLQHRVDAATAKLGHLVDASSKGAVTRFDVLRQQDETTAMQQALARLLQEQSALQRERLKLEERARRLPVELEGMITALRSERSQLQQQVTLQRTGQRVVVTAPVAGRLASVEIHVGDSIAPRQLLATVVPEQLQLLAEIYVPSSAIGRMRRGQNVRLMYDAFPVEEFGAFAGKVQDIAEVVLLPAEIPQAFALREAVFKVRVTLEAKAIRLQDGQARLRPGMLLGADIVVETRTLASWLLEPLRTRPRMSA
ncbi:MAG: HlyD family efflux transporter periplasmic adaptor subunit [Gammaproteobacteria bacterium]|nr:HlyD family efflux transporter periplasmic adaptor subunit [Gammaproteobacteria bacterium]